MPVAKLLGTSTVDAMKSEEGTDSLDTFIRQAVGKEPLFSFSRTGDSPVQWIQLLHALDQQDLPGWPLLAPMKVQMQKCEKCAREFCSPINYRRHIRVHRRSLNFHKEPQKYRDLLGAFWDKLSYDEAKEIMSFKDVNLEEVPGSSIVRNIAANLRKPIFLSLPQVYVKAGSVLVDIIQGKPSRFPVSSQELFSVLDDASERTFLSAGTAESLQKFVFDGEAGKIGLEIKNLIACTSFLVEQRLVKAWLADKDAEALRCQKLLVEEEEAAQKRQAELLERKRQRKLRQKEQKAKDQPNEEKTDLYAASEISETTPPAETSSPPTSVEADSFTPDELTESTQIPNSQEDIAIETQGAYQKTQHFVARWQVPKSQKGGRNGFHGNHYNNNNNNSNNNSNTMLKREQTHKHREQRAINHGSKVWTKKPKSENGGEVVKTRVQNDAINQTNQSNCQLMIGSISVTVRSCQENGNTEVKKNSGQTGTSRSTVKFWRPRHEPKGQLVDQALPSDNDGANPLVEDGDKPEAWRLRHEPKSQLVDQALPSDINGANPLVEDGDKQEAMPFSIDAAKAFLSQRWKEAISGEHSKLVLSSTPEPLGEPNGRTDHPMAEPHERTVLGNADNSTNGGVKPKSVTRGEKGVKTKYIPKQRVVN